MDGPKEPVTTGSEVSNYSTSTLLTCVMKVIDFITEKRKTLSLKQTVHVWSNDYGAVSIKDFLLYFGQHWLLDNTIMRSFMGRQGVDGWLLCKTEKLYVLWRQVRKGYK